MHALCECAQTARAMIDRIHRGDDGEENLRRADVARGFVPPDVLLARLQRKTISGAAFGIVRNAHESAGQMAFVLVARGEVCRVRAAKSQRHAETLRAADRDNNERTGVMCSLDEVSVITNRAIRRGILNERAENGVVEFET